MSSEQRFRCEAGSALVFCPSFADGSEEKGGVSTMLKGEWTKMRSCPKFLRENEDLLRSYRFGCILPFELRAASWLSGVWLCSPFPHSIMDGKEVAGLLAVLTLMYVWAYIATWWCTCDCPTFYLWCSSRACLCGCLSKASQHDFHCKKWTPPKPPNPKAMKF